MPDAESLERLKEVDPVVGRLPSAGLLVCARGDEWWRHRGAFPGIRSVAAHFTRALRTEIGALCGTATYRIILLSNWPDPTNGEGRSTALQVVAKPVMLLITRI